MRYLKAAMIVVASLALTGLMGLAGCDEDHHYRGDRDRSPRYEGHDSDRHEQGDRHEDRGGDSGHNQGEHGDR